MNQYTDTQLKQALARMLPQQVFFRYSTQRLEWHAKEGEVLDTELLHLCWLEETLGEHDMNDYFHLFEHNCLKMTHATWQQRTVALAKVKGIEIV